MSRKRGADFEQARPSRFGILTQTLCTKNCLRSSRCHHFGSIMQLLTCVGSCRGSLAPENFRRASPHPINRSRARIGSEFTGPTRVEIVVASSLCAWMCNPPQIGHLLNQLETDGDIDLTRPGLHWSPRALVRKRRPASEKPAGLFVLRTASMGSRGVVGL